MRDAEGRPTGLLLEEAQKLVTAVMPDANSEAARERRIRFALEQYVRWGLTGVHDAGTELEDIAILKRLAKSGELPIRVYAMALATRPSSITSRTAARLALETVASLFAASRSMSTVHWARAVRSCRRRIAMHRRHQG